MRVIREILNLPRQDGMYGVEIEVEGDSHQLQRCTNSDLWLKERDGSLGDGIEFVLCEPSDKDYLKDYVINLERAIKRSTNTDLRNQERAGVHIHVNVQEWSTKRLFNFICLYYLFEEVLVDWCGGTRSGNHFCLRMKDAGYILHLIVKSLEEDDLKLLDTDTIRYASLNLTSLFTFGSLELRSMRTPDNFDYINTWIEMIDCLVVYSGKWENPVKFLQSFDSLEELAEDVFGEYEVQLSCFSPNFLDKLRVGLEFAEDIAYCRDWTAVHRTPNPFREVFNKNAGYS